MSRLMIPARALVSILVALLPAAVAPAAAQLRTADPRCQAFVDPPDKYQRARGGKRRSDLMPNVFPYMDSIHPNGLIGPVRLLP